MWPFNKKELPKPEEKKPIEVDIIISIVLVNNRTDKEYHVASRNEHGIKIIFTDDEVIRLRQRTERADDDNNWQLIGSFQDFSVAAIEWKTVILPPNEDKE